MVLVGGHESREGTDLAAWAAPGGREVTGAGRPLTEMVRRVLADSGQDRVCVMPMTLGRDPKLVADTARSLQWIAQDSEANRGRIVLADPFGSMDHLVGWLRAAAGGAPRTPATAVLVTAPAAGPFEDADLFRVARLVRQYGHHRWVEVAFDSGDLDVAEGIERCRLLGADRIATVRAAFGPPPPGAVPDTPDTTDLGPLLSRAAVDGILSARCADALHRLAHGDDGIAAGLDAEHGHGFAHTHGPGGHHTHGPTAPHEHGHDHSHP